MSVLIKGMKMPNNCGACPLRLAWCRERLYMATRPPRCPLTELPDHGDLIEKDVVLDGLDLMAANNRLHDAYDFVKSCEAVIPAERSEE